MNILNQDESTYGIHNHTRNNKKLKPNASLIFTIMYHIEIKPEFYKVIPGIDNHVYYKCSAPLSEPSESFK